MIPIFPPPERTDSEPGGESVEEIQAALAALRRQKLQLEQRERRLLRALAAASRGRLREMVEAGGVPAAAIESLVRRTVGSRAGSAADSGADDPREATTAQPGAAAAERVRKAPLRFRHPDDPGLVWSGRGKTPRWVLELQAQGRLERARIAPEEN